MPNLIDQIRQRIGPAPRRIPADLRPYLFTRPQIWAVMHKDKLLDYYRHQEFLVREGTVVWGAVVQANMLAYSVGPADVPSTIIYSLDNTFDDHPEGLVDIASRLRDLRGGKWDNQEEQSYGDMLAIEKDRAMGIAIPRTIAGARPIRSTTIMWRRKHLPSGVLKGTHFPVLVHPSCNTALVVPSNVWPAEFAESWKIEPEDWHQKARTSGFVGATWAYLENARAKVAKSGVLDSLFIRLYVDEPTDGFDITHWAVHFDSVWHPSRHFLSEVAEFKFIIARSQADLFGNLELHHQADLANVHPDPKTAIQSVRF